jgi:hypothetical protein
MKKKTQIFFGAKNLERRWREESCSPHKIAMVPTTKNTLQEPSRLRGREERSC